MASAQQIQRANKILDDEIAALKQQVRDTRTKRQRRNVPAGATAANVEEDLPNSNAQATVSEQQESLAQEAKLSPEVEAANKLADQRSEHIKQFQVWINEDRDMLSLLLKIAGADDRKRGLINLLINVALSTVFLIAGLILSIVATPTNLAEFFRR